MSSKRRGLTLSRHTVVRFVRVFAVGVIALTLGLLVIHVRYPYLDAGVFFYALTNPRTVAAILVGVVVMGVLAMWVPRSRGR